MEKLKMHSPDLVAGNIEKIAALFPNCITEAKDATGKLTRAVDFDLLRQELSGSVVEGPQERYRLDWPGRNEAVLLANAPIAKTLRPCPQDSSDFQTTKNIFIEGDNLDALKLLRETYLRKVKLIYIDPPYNLGGDFIYNDDFVKDSEAYLLKTNQQDAEGNRLVENSESNGRFHSEWLSMIYSRLNVAKDLLTDDGIMVISIDENENANLRKLCDMVLGAKNYAGEIIWKNSSKNDQDYISIQHEYFIVYVRDKAVNKGQWTEKKQGLDEIYKAFETFRRQHKNDWIKIHEAAAEWYGQFPESNPIRASKHYSWMDDRGIYFPDNISGPNFGQYVYDIPHPITGQACQPPASGWRFPKSTMEQRIHENRIHFGPDHTTVPNNKTYLKNTEYQSLTSLRFVDGRAASKRLEKLFGVRVFTNPKDEMLLKDLMKAFGIKNDDIILDFFAGSGTTMHAVAELNLEQSSTCRCILVQLPEDLHTALARATGSGKKVITNAINYLKSKRLPETISEITKERLRLCAAHFKASNPTGASRADLGFRALKVDTSNFSDVYYSPDSTKADDLLIQIDNIKSDRTPEDLLFQVMLDWGVDLGLPISSEKIAGKTVFFVDGNALAACFDSEVSEELVTALAKRRVDDLPLLKVVFRDAGYADDSAKINVEQIFKLLSPTTELRTL
jgi:adenine-specific DNA-methyltransferase